MIFLLVSGVSPGMHGMVALLPVAITAGRACGFGFPVRKLGTSVLSRVNGSQYCKEILNILH